MPRDRDGLAAWRALLLAHSRAVRAIEEDLDRAGVIPLTWYDVLLELRRAEAGRVRPRRLEGELLIAQPNLSRLIDRLAAAGLVERLRCDDDRRGQFVAITEAGRDLLGRMWPVYRAAIMTHVGDRLAGEGEAEALATLLGKLLARS